jgi:hypothetical protein
VLSWRPPRNLPNQEAGDDLIGLVASNSPDMRKRGTSDQHADLPSDVLGDTSCSFNNPVVVLYHSFSKIAFHSRQSMFGRNL